jgi:hypothetical protein
MAKAYEGFLKKFFLNLGLIDRRQFEGRHFRIGKSLNPDLPEKYRDEDWLFDDLQRLCARSKIEPIADKLWEAWRESRNLLFHYFPEHRNFVDLEEAEERIEQVRSVMDLAVRSGLLRGKYGEGNGEYLVKDLGEVGGANG